ncbi:NUDIX hydrolase [Paenibacillus kobensis]|uniref:NUDIX hydrolase n=1 Tax=Paenibacillus kobensis TaxID=59841 RepID=UPI000FDA5CE9|nr:NUDIX domain-containing protein [Paenibacillus kobensis]
MKLIRTITDSDFIGGRIVLLPFVSRVASRGVLLNEKKQIAMMDLATLKLSKLPGGGVEKGENYEQAFVREIKEETGYVCEIVHTLGYIEEHKNRNNFMQRSYCYIAKASNDCGPVMLTAQEKRLGMNLNWMHMKDAIRTLSHSAAVLKDHSSRFTLLRDLTIIEEADKWLNGHKAEASG